MSTGSPWLKHLPNALSVLRLVLTVVFPFATTTRPLVVAGAGLSDFADGWIARRYGLDSWIGGILDSVADKAFVICALVTFTVEGRMEAWQTLILLSRDFAVGGVALGTAWHREWAAFKQMPARLPGKLTTATLFVFFLWATLTTESTTAFMTMGALAAACSVVAAFDYLRRFRIGLLERR